MLVERRTNAVSRFPHPRTSQEGTRVARDRRTSHFTLFVSDRQADLWSAVKHEVIVGAVVGTFPLMLLEISVVFAVKEATVKGRGRQQ